MIQIDEIGLLFTDAEYDEDGEVITEPQEPPGWNVNATGDVPEWAEYRVEPTTPRRVFGGVPTFFYTFPDQETYEDTPGTLDTNPDAVPQTITFRQAKQELLIQGKWATVLAFIDSIKDPLQRELMRAEVLDSQVYIRTSPQLVAMAKNVLKLSDADIDAWFINASKR